MTTAPAVCPLITLAVFAYNQELYIRDAVRSALSQTYEPLEIILSDDCSDDQTFGILQEEAAQYTGPHTVVLNRNETNLGICAHVNRVMGLAHGELVVMAAGDDVALPNRAETALAAWDRMQRRPDGLVFGFFSDALNGPVWQPPCPSVLAAKAIVDSGTAPIRGASAVWTRRLIQQWGPIPSDAGAEDQVLAFRASLGGGIVGDSSPVVIYRRNINKRSLRDTDKLAERLWRLRRISRFYAAYMCDLGILKGSGGLRDEEVQRLELDLQFRSRAVNREIAYLEQGTRVAGLRYLLAVLVGRTWTRCHWKNRPIEALTILRHMVVGRSHFVKLTSADHHAPDELVKCNAKGSSPEGVGS